MALIKALRGMMGTVSPELLLAAAERIFSAAEESLDSAAVIQLEYDPGFVPPPGTIAIDFGPEDGEAAEGFEKMTEKDLRLFGDLMKDLRRPGEDDLLGDGILGIQELTLDAPNGTYRMILMTENLSGSPYPFSLAVEVNGLPRKFSGSDPAGLDASGTPWQQRSRDQ